MNTESMTIFLLFFYLLLGLNTWTNVQHDRERYLGIHLSNIDIYSNSNSMFVSKLYITRTHLQHSAWRGAISWDWWRPGTHTDRRPGRRPAGCAVARFCFSGCERPENKGRFGSFGNNASKNNSPIYWLRTTCNDGRLHLLSERLRLSA